MFVITRSALAIRSAPIGCHDREVTVAIGMVIRCACGRCEISYGYHAQAFTPAEDCRRHGGSVEGNVDEAGH